MLSAECKQDCLGYKMKAGWILMVINGSISVHGISLLSIRYLKYDWDTKVAITNMMTMPNLVKWT